MSSMRLLPLLLALLCAACASPRDEAACANPRNEEACAFWAQIMLNEFKAPE